MFFRDFLGGLFDFDRNGRTTPDELVTGLAILENEEEEEEETDDDDDLFVRRLMEEEEAFILFEEERNGRF